MPCHGSNVQLTISCMLKMLLKAFPTPKYFKKIQFHERSQVKCNVNKNGVDYWLWQFSCYWQGQIQPRNSNISTRVSQLVLKDGKLWQCHIERSEVWLYMLPRTLVNSCTPSATLWSSTRSSARPAVATRDLATKSVTPEPHPPCAGLWGGTASRRGAGAGHLPATGCKMLLSVMELRLAGTKDLYLPHISDRASRLLLGAVCTSGVQQLTPLANGISVGLRGLNEPLKYWFSLH